MRKIVLVVDAEGPTTGHLAHLATACGLQVITARDVEGAMQQLHRQPDIALVLCRVMLPGASGFVLLDRMRRLFEHLPVVLCVPSSDMRIGVQAFRRGAADILPEDATRPALEACLQRVLVSGRLYRERLFSMRRMERTLSRQTAELRHMAAELERSYDITIEAMGDALDLRDEETEGHSKRVTAYAVALARSMELGPDQLKTIARGAFLHDVGKIAIPDAILLKPGRLTPDEMEIMRSHCEHGYNIVSKIPFLADAAEIIYAHQERFDGSGYPRGIRGEEIPLGARIFAIADVLDAITSDRPYRQRSSFAQAMVEIERCRGRQFDPRVVDAFLRMPHSTWPLIRGELGRQFSASAFVGAAA